MTLKKRFYDILTWFTTNVLLAYIMAPFFLLEFGSTVAFYDSVKWSGHIIGEEWPALRFIVILNMTRVRLNMTRVRGITRFGTNTTTLQ